MSDLTLEQVGGILSKTTDEVMFLVQSGKLQASVDQDTMAWKFDLTHVLEVKQMIESKENLTEQQLLVE